MFAVSRDYVVRAGEIGQCMYFIRAGTCMVLLPLTPEDGAASDDVVGGHGERFSHVKTIGSGDYFGEVCVQNVLVLQPISPLVRMAGVSRLPCETHSNHLCSRSMRHVRPECGRFRGHLGKLSELRV